MKQGKKLIPLRMKFTKAISTLLLVFAVIFGVLMAVDLLFLQAGIDGIGLPEQYPGTVVRAEKITLQRRVSKSGAEGSLYEQVQALDVAFTFVRDGQIRTSSRYFLLGGGELAVPISMLADGTQIHVGEKVVVHYIPRTDVAFVKLGLLAAAGYWLKVYALFMAFGSISISAIFAMELAQRRTAQIRD